MEPSEGASDVHDREVFPVRDLRRVFYERGRGDEMDGDWKSEEGSIARGLKILRVGFGPEYQILSSQLPDGECHFVITTPFAAIEFHIDSAAMEDMTPLELFDVASDAKRELWRMCGVFSEPS
jgi:hypothetical protein